MCPLPVRGAGYSTNAIEVWRYPALTPVATLTGHTARVLFLATSPDGQSIVTGAGALLGSVPPRDHTQ